MSRPTTAAVLVFSLLLALLVVGAVCAVWLIRDVRHRHGERVVALEAELPALRVADPIDAATACALLEHHLLTRKLDQALTVSCEGAEIERTGHEVLRLSGALYASSMDNAILGGGFTTPHCIARTAEGWAVVGQAGHLDECAFDAEPDASAEAVAQEISQRVAEERRALAEAAIAAVRSALEGTDPVPTECPALEPASGRAVGFVDADLWSPEGFGEAGGFWRSVTSPAFTACAEGEEPTEYSLGCGLADPWRYVLVLDEATKDPPSLMSDDQFIGGHYRATLKLVDMERAAVGCARPLELSLAGTVVLGQGEWITMHFHDRVKALVCDEVEAMTGEKVALDPYWRC